MSIAVTGAIGAAISRVEGREKVTGQAKYAYEYPQEEVAYAAIISSTVAKGTVRHVDACAALELPGVLAADEPDAEALARLAEGTAIGAVVFDPDYVVNGDVSDIVVAATDVTVRATTKPGKPPTRPVTSVPRPMPRRWPVIWLPLTTGQ